MREKAKEYKMKNIEELPNVEIHKQKLIKKTINDVIPNGSIMKPDNMNYYEMEPETYSEYECDRIDKYRNNFFSFNNKINNSSHQTDAVDMINMSDKAQKYPIGMSVADVFDNLTKDNYKTLKTSQCRIPDANL